MQRLSLTYFPQALIRSEQRLGEFRDNERGDRDYIEEFERRKQAMNILGVAAENVIVVDSDSALAEMSAVVDGVAEVAIAIETVPVTPLVSVAALIQVMPVGLSKYAVANHCLFPVFYLCLFHTRAHHPKWLGCL